MAILVVCTGCRKRFSVSDQFAGKSGPCPSCKTVIRIPGKGEEVKVHAPEEFGGGGRSTTGQLVLKPIARSETRFSLIVALAISGAVILAVIGAYLGGQRDLFGTKTEQQIWTQTRTQILACTIALVLITPPLVVAGYTFLRPGDDLDPYRGKALYLRASICSAAYIILWGLYCFFATGMLTDAIWSWMLVAAPFFVLGALAALSTLDLDFGSGFLHYTFYILVTIALRWLADFPAIWEVPKRAAAF
jgi:hypothetical protein